tara:strand:+ start:291 stop:677 length:387 start_codon:yes stop_codon:yes gene_type:complete
MRKNNERMPRRILVPVVDSEEREKPAYDPTGKLQKAMMKLFDYAKENPTKCGSILDEILVFLYEREIIDLADRITIVKSKLDHHRGRAQKQRATHDERVTKSEEAIEAEKQRIRKNRSDNGSKRMKGL